MGGGGEILSRAFFFEKRSLKRWETERGDPKEPRDMKTAGSFGNKNAQLTTYPWYIFIDTN